MSHSEQPEDKVFGQLAVRAPLGVEIEIFDSDFRKLYIGVAPASLSVQPGLYSVVWRAGGRSEERLVRVREGRTTTEDGGNFPLGSAPPSGLDLASPIERQQFSATVKAVSSKDPLAESEILIVVRSSDDRPTADLGRYVRIRDRFGVDVRSLGLEDIRLSDPANKLAVLRYRVAAGSYSLCYEAFDRRSLEQTVFAFGGRQTVTFLKYGSKLISEESKEGLRLVPRRGIDPTQTTLVSVPLNGSRDMSLENNSRVADIMLHKLAEREVLYNPDLDSSLMEPDTDPYLKLYGAALFVNLELKGRVDFSRRPSARTERVRRLIDHLQIYACPDVECLRWCVEEMTGNPNTLVAAPLETPPMLDLVWRWASALSVSHPQVVGRSPSIAAAARVSDSAPPWLVWRRSEKVERKPVPPVDINIDEDDVLRLTKILADLVTETRPSDIFATGFPNISTSTAEYANAALSVLSEGRQLHADEIARRLAFTTGTPGTDLAPQLGQAINELQKRTNDDEA